MGQLACVRLSKPMLESCWETVGWYVDFHVDALLLSAGKRPDNSKIRFPSFFGQSNPLKRHDVPRTRCLRAHQASASSWSSPGRSSAGAFPPGVKYPSSVAYLTSRDRRRRCLSSASGPGLEMILTSPRLVLNLMNEPRIVPQRPDGRTVGDPRPPTPTSQTRRPTPYSGPGAAGRPCTGPWMERRVNETLGYDVIGPISKTEMVRGWSLINDRTIPTPATHLG